MRSPRRPCCCSVETRCATAPDWSAETRRAPAPRAAAPARPAPPLPHAPPAFHARPRRWRPGAPARLPGAAPPRSAGRARLLARLYGFKPLLFGALSRLLRLLARLHGLEPLSLGGGARLVGGALALLVGAERFLVGAERFLVGAQRRIAGEDQQRRYDAQHTMIAAAVTSRLRDFCRRSSTLAVLFAASAARLSARNFAVCSKSPP